MTEQEAWQYIADVFQKENYKEGAFIFDGWAGVGICSFIQRISQRVSAADYWKMEGKISLELGDRVILAPLTLEGAKVRRAFCLEQVEKLKGGFEQDSQTDVASVRNANPLMNLSKDT